jgi:hypothetical protein
VQELSHWLVGPAVHFVFSPSMSHHSALPSGDIGQMACVSTMLRILDSLFVEHLPANVEAEVDGLRALSVTPTLSPTSRKPAQAKSYPGVTDKVCGCDVFCGCGVCTCSLRSCCR